MMKQYVLADAEAQKTVDLDKYGDMIADAVFEVIDEDDMVVGNRKGCYYIGMDRLATEGEEAAVKAILRGSDLGKYCTTDGVLFKGIEVPVKEIFPNREN